MTQTTTSWKVVVPFYVYAALSFLALAAALLFSTNAFTGHYFHPRLLAITHMAALGWGTMIILGSGHQLIPVLIDGRLYSEGLARITFWLTAAGIPLLVTAFWNFQTNWLMQSGAVLVVAGLLLFAANTMLSIGNSKEAPVQVYFLLTATIWLCLTALVGALLVFNFSYPVFNQSHLHYLRLHAHMGLAGWFLLLIIGVASRLLPMFLVSEYTNTRLLWWIFVLINTALLSFLADVLYNGISWRLFIYLFMVAAAVLLFAFFCYKAWRHRIRKRTEEPVQLSLMAVALLLVPLVTAGLLIVQLLSGNRMALRLTLVYGSLVLLGWITAIILGMTFKTLPFIIWNKLYATLSGKAQVPAPKDLFSMRLVRWQMAFYLPGLVLLEAGIISVQDGLMKAGAGLFLLTAILYNWNVGKLILQKIKKDAP